jgi:predicted metal-dependent peptidase
MLLTPIEEKLTVARIGLMLRASFFGNLASRMKLVDASNWCDTAATDGKNFYYNADFVEKLSVKNLEFLFGHEILHICFDHFGRKGSRHPRISNIAQDYAVNLVLSDEKIGTPIDIVPILLDPQYRGMAWENIYDLLIENAQEISLDDLMSGMDSLDDHISQDDSGDGDSDDDGKEGSGRPRYSKAEWQALRDEIKEAMVQAHAAAAGNVPAAIKRLIQDMTEPKMNWRELLQMNIQSIVRSNYSFSRPSRKGWASGAILPGMIPEQTIDIAIALDMSGSIGQNEISIFLGEVSGILAQYTDYSIDLFTYDTAAYNHIKITSENANDLLTYEPVGGGGTDYRCILEHLKEQNLVPKKLINFTDLYVSDFVEELGEYCDCLFLVFGNPGSEAPYGQTVHYTD